MTWRAWSAAAVLAVAAGCASEPEYRGPVLPDGSAPVSHPAPPTSFDESDSDSALLNWKTSVLDRADSDTLHLVRSDIESRIERLTARDTELSYLPPGIAIEERLRLARRISFEKQRLKMLDGRE